MHESDNQEYRWRLLIVVFFLFIIILGLIGRIFYLGIMKHKFLLAQGNMRSLREISIPAHRGIITDRNGEPLAISIPTLSIWTNPQLLSATNNEITKLALLLEIPKKKLTQKIAAQKNHTFVYLKRSIPLEIANKILELQIPGIYSEKAYKRFYPEAEALAQVIGFTNIDDQGQEGLELAYDSWLRGTPGKTQVIKDCLGNIVTNLEVISEPQQGNNLVLSIDRRIQYLAYQELKHAVEKHQAEYGSVVILSAKTGEILAMANFPSYDPNNRTGVSLSKLRNRAVTDAFEPGSTIKPFTITNALVSGKYTPNSLINTSPGRLIIGNKVFEDAKRVNHGVLTVTGVLQKSSDIGTTKITLSLPSNSLPDLLHNLGFGQSTQSGFPGEASGMLPEYLKPNSIPLATLSFGYGISTTALQLAYGYLAIASSGLSYPITFLKNDTTSSGKRVLSPEICGQMLRMLEAVTDIGGTGKKAQVPGYRVGGKTGTAYIASPHGGYYQDRYFSTFLGIAPMSDPQFVTAIIIKDPRGKQYYGAQVAAPTFANIMNGVLRIFKIPPDDKKNLDL